MFSSCFVAVPCPAQAWSSAYGREMLCDVFTSVPVTLGFAELSTGLRNGSGRIQQGGWRHQEIWGIWGDLRKIYGWLRRTASPASSATPWLSASGNGDVCYVYLAMQWLKHESGRIAGIRRAAEVCQELSQLCKTPYSPHFGLSGYTHASSQAKENLAQAERSCCCALGWVAGG